MTLFALLLKSLQGNGHWGVSCLTTSYTVRSRKSLAKPYQSRPGTLGVVNPCSFPEFGPLSHFGNIAALRS